MRREHDEPAHANFVTLGVSDFDAAKVHAHQSHFVAVFRTTGDLSLDLDRVSIVAAECVSVDDLWIEPLARTGAEVVAEAMRSVRTVRL